MNSTNILIRHNYIDVPSSDHSADINELATVIMNLSYYGKALSPESYKVVVKLSPMEL